MEDCPTPLPSPSHAATGQHATVRENALRILSVIFHTKIDKGFRAFPLTVACCRAAGREGGGRADRGGGLNLCRKITELSPSPLKQYLLPQTTASTARDRPHWPGFFPQNIDLMPRSAQQSMSRKWGPLKSMYFLCKTKGLPIQNKQYG